MKKFFTVIFTRSIYTLLFVAIQLGLLLGAMYFLGESFSYFYILCIALSICTGLHLLNTNINSAYKIAWLVALTVFPIFGGLMYLMFGKKKLSGKQRERMRALGERYEQAMLLRPGDSEALKCESGDAALHCAYITKTTGVPPYRRTQTRYFPSGEEYFAALKEELVRAQRFIFLEYFIINDGQMWGEILAILKEKAQAGVDVRLIYDDMGCIVTLPRHYERTLGDWGIKTCVFHRFNSILDSRFNTRDHRKICVIDGNVGFTGGINLADEYINAIEKYGHWKDSGVMLKGEAVWSLTTMFLTMWCGCRCCEEDFAAFAPWGEPPEDDGFVQPYSDTPGDEEQVGETVYMNLINRARRYVYITTPYLVIDDQMMMAMQTAAKSGVDVRLIVPGIPDKKLVYALNRANYEPLLEAGVRIFEYSPGFIHAKSFVSDDDYAVVGTINLDYRSLYLHYECAVWMFRSSAVGQLKEDFLTTQAKCREMERAEPKRFGLLRGFAMALLRAFSPMM